MKTTDFNSPVPEFEQVRACYEAPTSVLDSRAAQIQLEARMHQIMSSTTPAARPQSVRSFVRLRRATIASVGALAVGLGGATAAAAAGIDNPVGDWVVEFFTDNDIVVADGPVLFENENSAAACAVGFTVVSWEAIEDPNEYSAYVGPDGTMVLPEAHIKELIPDSGEEFSPTDPVMQPQYFSDSAEVQQAQALLAAIDLNSLPGERPQVPDGLIDLDRWVFNAAEFDPVFTDALTERFNTALTEAGLNPDDYELVPTVGCTVDDSNTPPLEEQTITVQSS